MLMLEMPAFLQNREIQEEGGLSHLNLLDGCQKVNTKNYSVSQTTTKIQTNKTFRNVTGMHYSKHKQMPCALFSFMGLS